MDIAHQVLQRNSGSVLVGVRHLVPLLVGGHLCNRPRDDVEARELKNLVHGSCTLAKYDQGYVLSSQAYRYRLA